MNVMTKPPEMVLGVPKGFRYKGFFDERQAKFQKLNASGQPLDFAGTGLSEQEVITAFQRYQVDPNKAR